MGGGGEWKDKDKDKVSIPEDPLEWSFRTSEHVNIAIEHVSHSLIHCVQAYLSSKPNAKGKDTIIIDSGATSQIGRAHV